MTDPKTQMSMYVRIYYYPISCILFAHKKIRPFIRLTSPSRKNGVGRFFSLSASEAADQL